MELILIIKNIEADQAHLSDESGNKNISWPLDCLPPEAKPGDRFVFLVSDASSGKKLAKEILNEMLRVDDAPSQ